MGQERATKRGKAEVAKPIVKKPPRAKHKMREDRYRAINTYCVFRHSIFKPALAFYTIATLSNLLLVDNSRKLTYMSIAQKAIELALNRKLVNRASSYGGPKVRRMFVTPEIDGYTRHPFADTPDDHRFAQMAASLDAFCEGGVVTVSEDPDNKPPDIMLARVHDVKDEFWSMRITDPENTPGLRLLGGFCAKDEFVALKWEFREKMTDFDAKVDDLKDDWCDYFGDLKPFSGATIDEYISNFDLQ